MHELTLLEWRARPIFETVHGIAPVEFALITSTVEKTAYLLQRHKVLKGCAVMVAGSVFNNIVDDEPVVGVDYPEV